MSLLGTVLRSATFLRETQWVHLDGAAESRRGRMVGKLRRLDGTGPYTVLPRDAEWPLAFALERDFVYLGTADGARWKLLPFVLLEDGTSGHPLPLVLDTIDRRGRLKFLEPVSGREDIQRALPGADWSDTTWTAFLDKRRELAAAWTLTLESPHAGFVVKVEADLADGLKPGAVLEDYRLVQKLGEGGAAVVWEAEDVHDGTTCALKVLKGDVAASETEVARFEDEIRRLKKLANEGCKRVVQPVFSFRAQDGETRRVVLRMPLYKGTLKEHAANLRAVSGNAPPDEAVLTSWARMALEALSELHARGVVHRDVKPSNFLLNDAGELAISDFGIARDESGRAGLTKTGDLLGTQLYMAPEQLRSSKSVTTAADVYALAVSLDELWAGEPRAMPGKGMEGTLGELVRAMAAQDAEARPTSAQALERLGGAPVAAPVARAVTGSHPAVAAPVAASPTNPEALAEWRELYWWLMRGGQLKLLDQKALEKRQREAGLTDADVGAIRSSFKRDVETFLQAVVEAVEDGVLEDYEVEGLEEMRVSACISSREAQELVQSLVVGVRAPSKESLPVWLARVFEIPIATGTKVAGATLGADSGRKPGRLLTGKLHPSVSRVEFESRAGAGGRAAWATAGQGLRMPVELDGIEGIFFDDVDRPEDAPETRVTVWAVSPGSKVVELAPESRTLTTESQLSRSNLGKDLELGCVTPEGRAVTARLPANAWRLGFVEDLFFKKLVVVTDAAGRSTFPDAPVEPRWLRAVERCDRSESNPDIAGARQVTYRLKLRGLADAVSRTYLESDWVELENQSVFFGSDPLRVLVWPNVDYPLWKFFAVQVSKRDEAWNDFKWSLFTEHPGGHVTVCTSLGEDGRDGSSMKWVAGSADGCVVTRDRPRWLQLLNALEGAGGSFDLLPAVRPFEPRDEVVTLGLDIGSSVTCLAIARDAARSRRGEGKDASTHGASGPELDSLDFNQVNPTREGEPAPVFSRFSTAAEARSSALRPFMGVKGAFPDCRGPGAGERLTRLPSLLSYSPSFPENLTAEQVARALPVRDLCPLPSGYGESLDPESTWRTRLLRPSDAFEKTSDLSRACLSQFITQVLLMAAVRIKTGATLNVGLPASVPKADWKLLAGAVEEGCARASRYTGREFSAGALSPANEAVTYRAIRVPRPASLPLVVACHLGQHALSLDAVAFAANLGPLPADLSFSRLGAESVRFGTELMLRKVQAVLGEQLIRGLSGNEQRARLILSSRAEAEAILRRMVEARGYAGFMQHLERTADQDLLVACSRAYFEWLKEFIARFTAAVLRNPYRYSGFRRRVSAFLGRDSPDSPEYADMARLLDGPDGKSWLNRSAIQVEIILTGEGWRELESLSPRHPLFLSLGDRVHELCRLPTPGEPASVSASFGAMVRPDFQFVVGLKRRPEGESLLEEALSDALALRPPGIAEPVYPPAPNGLCEVSTFPGRQPPWYAFVGLDAGQVNLPTGPGSSKEFPDRVPVPRGDWVGIQGVSPTPEFPGTLLDLSRKLGIPVTFEGLGTVSDGLCDAFTLERRRSLLGFMYERVIAQGFEAPFLP